MNHSTEPKISQGADGASKHSETKLPVRVADVMTKDVITVAPDRTLADAISLIAIHHFHHLVVTDASAKVVGVVSDRDILRAVARTPDWHTYPVRHVMTANPVTVRAESSFFMAVSKMLSNKFNSLPVVDENGTVTGIVTSTDVLWFYQKMVESMQVTLQQNGLIEFPLSD